MGRGCLRALALLLLVGILLLLGWIVIALRQEHALRQEIAQLRQEGVPTSPTELTATGVGEGCNGAPDLMEALAALVAYQEEHRIIRIHRPGQPPQVEGFARTGHLYLPLDPRPMSPEEIQVARRVLGDLDGELTRLEEALACPRMEFTVDWRPWHQETFFFRSLGFPDVKELSGAANLLLTRAGLAVERQGRHRRATRDLELALALVRRMEHRFPLAYLAQSVVLGGILRDLPHLLAVSGLDPAVAQPRLDPLLAQLDRQSDPTPALVGERALHLDQYERLLLFGRAAPDQEALPAWWPRTALRADARAYLRLMAEILPLANLPYHRRRDRDEALRRSIAGLPFFCLVARNACTTSLDCCIGADQRRRFLRQARLGLAAARFEQEQGRWPREPEEVLALLAGDAPLENPFTGEPFMFTLVEDSFAVSGPDQQGREDPFRMPPAPPAWHR